MFPGNRETAVVRTEGETPNDRNDRGMRVVFLLRSLRMGDDEEIHTTGIRRAVAWYSAHISLINPTIRGQRPKPRPTALLLTDDVQSRIKGEKEGVKCLSGIHLRFKTSAIFDY